MKNKSAAVVGFIANLLLLYYLLFVA